MFLMVLGLLNLLAPAGDAAAPWWNYPGLELWKVFNLVLFVGALVYLLRRPLNDALRSRREAIKRELVQAQKERDQALAMLKDVEERLSKLDAETAVIRQQALAEAAAERDRIAAATEAELAKLRAQAQREIESTGKTVKHELRKFAAEQSVKLAEEVIRREMRPDDDARLIRLSVDELGRSRN